MVVHCTEVSKWVKIAQRQAGRWVGGLLSRCPYLVLVSQVIWKAAGVHTWLHQEST